MKKLNVRLLKNWRFAVPLVILVLVALTYVGRSWVRVTLVPKTEGLYYGHQVDSRLQTEYKKLGEPFQTLGFVSSPHFSRCVMTYAYHFEIESSCAAGYASFSDKVSSLSPDLGVRAASLESALKANGWQGDNTSITTLGQNLSKGIDYTPDADYTKSFGKIQCDIDFNTAFSTPKPAAIAGRMTCSRQLLLFPHAKCGNGITYYDKSGKQVLFCDSPYPSTTQPIPL